jgi:serine protease AprX
MARITINGVTVDPLAQGAALEAANLEFETAASSNYILIQATAPLGKAQKAELTALGAEILEYVPEDTYLCRYSPADLSPIRSLPYVAWANIYLRDFKISPALADLPPGPPVRGLLEIANHPLSPLSGTPKTVDVVFHDGVDPEMVREKLAAAAGLNAENIQLGSRKVRLVVPRGSLAQLSALDEVRHLEEVAPLKLHNDVARTILRVETPGTPSQFEGAGQIVAVADSGFDTGSIADTHPAFAGRVAKLYDLGRPGQANDPNGHGTHVAGSVLGDGHSEILGRDIRGTAPRAHLVLQSVLDAAGGLTGIPDDMHDLFRTPYVEDRARIHTNSWGSTIGDGSYGQRARELDEFVWKNRDMVICFAAGNQGTDANSNGRVDNKTVTSPGTAKNCISVGATENDRPELDLTYSEAWPSKFPQPPLSNDRLADNPQGMAAFSGRGLTVDQRFKPDVVAPGTFILSARSRATSKQGWGLSEDPLYMFNGGTSMATPLVAGCTALLREYLLNEHQLENPSAALVKALLINGAQAVTGQYVPTETGGVPNESSGFGRVDLAATIGPFTAPTVLELRDEATLLDTDDQDVFELEVRPSASLLKATLVWTDPAGESLQNDLDLIVRCGDRERHGNVGPNSNDFDRVNNVEQVMWRGVPAGIATIIVRAHRVPRHPQSYALVVRIT